MIVFASDVNSTDVQKTDDLSARNLTSKPENEFSQVNRVRLNTSPVQCLCFVHLCMCLCALSWALRSGDSSPIHPRSPLSVT